MATNTTHATSQASVSESNRSRIVKHLYHNGISSRAQIAKALELTPAAITKITARLIEAGMIEETGDLEGSKNRRSIGLKLDTTRFRIIGIKFARSLVQIGVFDLCGNTLSFENLPTVYDTPSTTPSSPSTSASNNCLTTTRPLWPSAWRCPAPTCVT